MSQEGRRVTQEVAMKIPPTMQLITSSRLKDARACPRLHRIRYELGYRPAEEPEALRFGTLGHEGLKAWWEAQGDRLEATLTAIRTATHAEAEPDLFALAKAEAMLTGYDARWKAEPYEVLAVEVPFETELRNPMTGRPSQTWRLAGKIDAIVRDLRDGRVLVVEHKTATGDISPGSEYWRRLRMDGQVSVYFEGARALGYDVAGCLYDVLGKPAHRPSDIPVLDDQGVKVVLDASGQRVRTKDGKKWRQTADTELGYVLQTRPEEPQEYQARLMTVIAEAPMNYFQRGEVARLEEEMKDALYDVWQTAQAIRESELSGRHPRNPDACVRYGRTCPFFDACTGVASLEDPLRFRRVGSAHPELSPP
jgi:hypothetical protein